MKKRILILAAFGFLLGDAALLLIPALFNHSAEGVVFVSPLLVERLGSPAAAMALSLLVLGLYGVVCIGGSALYGIESWPMARSTVVHYLLIALGYLIPARLLHWNLNARYLLVIEGIMAAGYALIWLIMFLRCKAEVRELNELIREREERKRESEGRENKADEENY